MWGYLLCSVLMWLPSKQNRDKRNVQPKNGDRTAGNGATRVTDWEQESETSDKREGNKADYATADSTGYWEQKRS